MQLMVTSSHQTASLDRGTKILQLIWFDVEYEIENLFNEAEDLDEQIILAQVTIFYLSTLMLLSFFLITPVASFLTVFGYNPYVYSS